MENPTWSRRKFFAVGGAAGLVLLGVGCKKTLTCEDTSALQPGELATRTALAYRDAAEDPAKPCDACRFYVAASPGQCGTCTTVKGPIHPQGGCKAWAAKTVP